MLLRPSEDVDEMFRRPSIEERLCSMGMVTFFSTSSGFAPAKVVLTWRKGISVSGNMSIPSDGMSAAVTAITRA